MKQENDSTESDETSDFEKGFAAAYLMFGVVLVLVFALYEFTSP